MLLRGSVLSLGLAALLTIAAVSPGFAYGVENYQVTFAGTGVTPGAVGLGFWGWCAFGSATATTGGVPTAGTDGDCQFAEYVHPAGGGGFTCHVSLDLTQWQIMFSTNSHTNDFFFSGTATITDASLTPQQVGACLGFAGLPGTTFSNVDSELPAARGHHNFGNIFGTTNGEFQETVTLLP